MNNFRMAKMISSVRSVVSIPLRIKRSPTDLLKALSDTVTHEGINAPVYQYIDDPYTLPTSGADKKYFSLTRASGIKAAQLMISKYPQAFYKNDCDPHIPAYFPKKEFTEQELKYPSEELIYSLIDWGKIMQACDVYLKCKDEKIQVSEACKFALFEMLCIHNSSDMANQEPVFEDWYLKSPLRRSKVRISEFQESKWKPDSEAEKMFNELEIKSDLAYCSLIKGMAAQGEYKKANDLYNEMKSKFLIPNLTTYNSLIKLINYSTDGAKTKLVNANALLEEMMRYGIRPNLTTFNNFLHVLSSLIYNPATSLIKPTLKEMKLLGIQPSLATYSYVVRALCNKKDDISVLRAVIEEVEDLAQNEGLKWRDENDNQFFTNAMNKCFFNGDSDELARRLHKIMMKGGNRQFLNDFNTEWNYFEYYFKNILKFSSVEQIINEWNNAVPHVSSVSNIIIKSYLSFVSSAECYDFIPKFWSDLVMLKAFRSIKDPEIALGTLLETMNTFNPTEPNEILQGQYGEVVRNMIHLFPFQDEKSDDEKRFRVIWDGKMLSSAIQLFLKANDFLTAWHCYNQQQSGADNIGGQPNEKCLLDLFDHCVKNNDAEKGLALIASLCTYQYPSAENCIGTINEKLELTHQQKQELQKLHQNILGGAKNPGTVKLVK